MSRYILRFRKINKDTFDFIKKGVKKVETRAATKRYKNINKGDTLIFVCGKGYFSRKIRQVKHFKSIDALARTYPVKKVMPQEKTLSGMKKKYYSFPGYRQKINQFGLLAFEV